MFPLTVKVPESTSICPKEFVPAPERANVAPPVPVKSPDKTVAPEEVRAELLVTEKALVIVIPAVTLNVPPPRVTVPLPMLLAAETERVPPLTVVAHVPLFVPDKTRVPVLIFASVPLPVIVPAIVVVFPPASKEVIVATFNVTPRLALNVIPEVVKSVPPLPVIAPDVFPKLESLLIESTPPVKVVPPEYVFVPDKAKVPAPVFTRF
jgi:hypothetical protein